MAELDPAASHDASAKAERRPPVRSQPASAQPARLPGRATLGAGALPRPTPANISALQRTVGNRGAQRYLDRSAPDAARPPTVAERIRARQGQGASLDGDVRRWLEPSVGAGLENVRVHRDADADALARSVDARAFTAGTDIYFRADSYDPASPEGMHILAHEAAHVVQQANGPVPGVETRDGIRLSDPGDAAERSAEGTATAATSPAAVPRSTGKETAQRHGTPEDDPLDVQTYRGPLLPVQRHGTPEDDPLEVQTYAALTPVPGFTTAVANAATNVTIQRVATGISQGKAVEKYVAGIKKLKGTWAGLDEKGRADALGKEANARLKDADVPICSIVIQDFSGGTMGQFDFATWSIEVDRTLVAKPSVSDEELADAADTMYHEARHCEQWFRIARWLAGSGKNAKQINEAMVGDLPAVVAKKAADKPLKKSGALARAFMTRHAIEVEDQMLAEGAAWHQSIYGADRGHRNTVLTEMGPAGDRASAAREDYDDNYAAAVAKSDKGGETYTEKRRLFDTAEAEFQAILGPYQAKVSAGTATEGDTQLALASQQKRDDAEVASNEAFAAWEADFNAAKLLKETKQSTREESDKAYQAYRDLTEEADAWALGAAVKSAYKGS